MLRLVHKYGEQQLFDPELHCALKATQVGDLVVGSLVGDLEVGVSVGVCVVGADVTGFLVGCPEVGVLVGVGDWALVSHKLAPLSEMRTVPLS